MNLPQPVTREEIYLAYYIGMRGDFSLPANPATRIETYLAKLCGQSVTLPDEPITNVEMYLAKLCGETVTLPDVPVLRVEMYLAALCGETVNLPEEPYTKTEIYLAYAATSTVYDLDIDGDSATIEDTIEGANLYAQQLYGKTSQETLTGKNLMPVSEAVLQDSTDRTRTFRIDLPIGTYTISFDLSDIEVGTNTSFAVFMQLRYADNTQYDPAIITIDGSTTPGHKSFTFTTTKVVTSDASLSASNIRIALTNWDNGGRATLSNIQIESGSTASAYEKYCGGIPAPNPDYPSDVNVVTGGQTIQIMGKNLWNTTAYQENHFISANGTESTNTSTNTWGNIYVPAGTSMAISATPGDKSSTAIRVHAFTLAGVWKEQVAVLLLTGGNYGSATFTTPNEPILLRWCGSKKLSSRQLELGSTATAYQPYQSQSYEVNLGKNLFTSVWSLVKVSGDYPQSDNTRSTIDSSGTNNVEFSVLSTGYGGVESDYFKVNKGETYTVSFTSAKLPNRVYVTQYDASKTRVSTLNDVTQLVNTTITTTNDGYITVAFANTTEGSGYNLSNIQVELGSTATPYAPYFTPIELAGIGTYVDKIFKNTPESDLYNPSLIDGAWYKHAEVGKVVYDNASSFTLRNTSTAGTKTYALSTPFAYKVNSSATGLSNCLKFLGIVNGVAAMYNPLYNLDKIGFALYYNPTNPDASAVYFNSNKTTAEILAEQNIIFYYQLATSTDTQITEASLLEELEALYLAYTYAGITNIFISSSGGGLTVGFDAKVRKAAE